MPIAMSAPDMIAGFQFTFVFGKNLRLAINRIAVEINDPNLAVIKKSGKREATIVLKLNEVKSSRGAKISASV
jgi:hypothetical protein